MSRGGTAWTSFRREVAVARRCSDVAAGQDVFAACRLVECHPTSLRLLPSGALGVGQARTLIDALAHSGHRCGPRTPPCGATAARDDRVPYGPTVTATELSTASVAAVRTGRSRRV